MTASVASDNGSYGRFVSAGGQITGSVAIGNSWGITLLCPARAVGNTATDNPGGNLVTGARCLSSQNLAP